MSNTKRGSKLELGTDMYIKNPLIKWSITEEAREVIQRIGSKKAPMRTKVERFSAKENSLVKGPPFS